MEVSQIQRFFRYSNGAPNICTKHWANCRTRTSKRFMKSEFFILISTPSSQCIQMKVNWYLVALGQQPTARALHGIFISLWLVMKHRISPLITTNIYKSTLPIRVIIDPKNPDTLRELQGSSFGFRWHEKTDKAQHRKKEKIINIYHLSNRFNAYAPMLYMLEAKKCFFCLLLHFDHIEEY